MSKQYFLTTAIAYANAKPHIGFALELIYADTVARYRRLCGDDVIFLTGTDEHGQKMSRKAAEVEKKPQAFVDEMSQLYIDLAKRLNISNTDFIRTTQERHKLAVAEFWKRVDANGFITKKKYSGLYCIGCEEFKTEKSLVDGKCADHGTVPESIEEENYFFTLTAFEARLKALYGERPNFVVPESKFNEVKQLLEGGLEDTSISRSKMQLQWGIPVPGDETQVVYVWFDALVNYLTAIGFPDKGWETKWPADLHIIGKEINRFHTVLWPAMLMAANIEVPKQVGVHGWIHVDGQKMSKTIGNVIDPEELIEMYGVEVTRYLLLSQIPFTSDGDWSAERSRQKFTADLANNLGNLIFRVTSMLQKYFDGSVPARVESDMSGVWEVYRSQMDALRFDQALETILATATSLNQDIDQQKPWALAKVGDMKQLGELIYRWLEAIRQIAWMLRPFMPETSEKILVSLGQKGELDKKVIEEISVWGVLEAGAVLSATEPLFPRIES